ncbi:MAG: DUF2970 domain-containing protein [Gammaproteobacteria bacterium]
MSQPGLLQIIQSVIAAALGVQSNKNRERDFKFGSPKVFIVTGIIATVLFILFIRLIVSFVVG